jgi:hypothetical protein
MEHPIFCWERPGSVRSKSLRSANVNKYFGCNINSRQDSERIRAFPLSVQVLDEASISLDIMHESIVKVESGERKLYLSGMKEKLRYGSVEPGLYK